MTQSLTGDNSLSEDEDSPMYRHTDDVMDMDFMVQQSGTAHQNVVRLLEYCSWEEACIMLQTYGEALRAPRPPRSPEGTAEGGDSDESMEGVEERAAERYARYNRDEMCEVSDPELWTEIHGRSNDS